MGLSIPDDADSMVRLREIVRCLRAPGGCPWDREQTHVSLVVNLLEEAYEAAAAIRSDDAGHMTEELGDLLLQIVMHAEIASETDRFRLEDIARAVGDKLIRRHPHVFGETDAKDAEAVLKQWDAIKRQEKGESHTPYLEGVGEGLPALMRATKLQKKAAKVGFDWDAASAILTKVKEEIAELEEAMTRQEVSSIEEELGDLFFTLVNFGRKQGFDCEALLARANGKFHRRFQLMERALQENGQALEEATPAQMESAWNEAKLVE